MALISVVIPTRNRAHLVAQAVQSVLRQPQNDDLEIIVVDDGSTDETEVVLRRFGARIQVLQQQQKGPGAARNLGWLNATGRYIAFLDSDDLWFPWTAAVYRDCIMEFRQPSLVISSAVWFQDPSCLGQQAQGPLRARAFSDYLASADHFIWISASGLLIRRECRARFEEEEMNAEDLDLALHLGSEPNFLWLVSPSAFAYRRHGTSLIDDSRKTLHGINHLITEEAKNAFPGGRNRSRERWKLITRAARPAAMTGARGAGCRPACTIYCRTLRWHALLGRWKFILGFPLWAALQTSRRSWRRNRAFSVEPLRA